MKRRIRAYSQQYFKWYFDEMMDPIIDTTPRVKSFEPLKPRKPDYIDLLISTFKAS